MKVKINNVPKFSHEYLVTDTKVEELNDGSVVRKYRLGISKQLIVTTTQEGVKNIEFNTGKKTVKLPDTWVEFLN